MNITWALLMMALGGVGVQSGGHEADVSATLKSAANPPITAEQAGSAATNTAAGNASASLLQAPHLQRIVHFILTRSLMRPRSKVSM